MKIVHDQPPIINAIFHAGMNPSESAIYAYGDIIYNPSGKSIDEHYIVHESVHCRQQGDNPDVWWGRYLTDSYFRISQEVEAYAEQYDFICKTVKDRNRRNTTLWHFATVLSSPVYGSVIGTQSAYTMIKSKAKTK